MANTLNLGTNGNWATKEGSLLAYNSENNNYKPLPFNFERDSVATRVNKQGLIETVGADQPRIDYLNDSNGALLLEPSRTNKVTYSEDFSQSAWQKLGIGTGSAAIVTSDYAISPDGTQNASRLQCDLNGGVTSSGNQSLIAFVYSSSGNQTISIYLKSNNGQNQTIYFANTQTSGDTITITSEWQRFEFSHNTSTYVFAVGLRGRSGGDIDDTADILIWAAQAEEASYATSYIPTQGSAVTRLRDLSDTQNLSHVIGQTEGVIFYDAILVHKSTSTSEDLFELSIDDGSNQNIFFINNYNNALIVGLKSGGSTSFSNNSFNPTEGARYKLAFAYKQNDFALYINGNQIATDLSGTVPTMNQITFGNYYNNQISLSNIVKVNNLKLYNTRLSNSELASLTQV